MNWALYARRKNSETRTSDIQTKHGSLDRVGLLIAIYSPRGKIFRFMAHIMASRLEIIILHIEHLNGGNR